MLGHSEEELVKLKFSDVTHPEHVRADVENITRLVKGEIPIHRTEKRYLCKDGTVRWGAVTVTLIKDPCAGASTCIAMVEDINERKLAEDALRREQLLKARLMETSPAGIVMVGLDGRVTFANPQAERVLGLRHDDVIRRSYNSPEWHVTDLDGQPFPDESLPFRRVMETGRPVSDVRHAIQWPDGRRVLLSINGAPLFDRSGKIEGMVATIEDITPMVESERKLKDSLREKEALLREVHHRVKNNLQVICSLLNLQSRHVTDPAALRAFKDSESRVRAMSFVHEKLYMSRDFGLIDFSIYVKSLAEELMRSYRVEQDTVSLDLKLEDVRLGIDVAVPLGMILNELVSNCLKHAFPGGRRGEISVTLTKSAGGEVSLSVADNGAGFPQGADFRGMKSMGMMMVSTLAEQLEGTVAMEQAGGTRFTITFSTETKDKKGASDGKG
jgi:PAS domain S-box-containing protein